MIRLTQPKPAGKLLPYLVTIAAVLFIGQVKLWLNHLFQVESPLLLFFGAVAISAWYGGGRQGLVAIAASILFIFYHFIWPNPTAVEPSVWAVRFLYYILDCIVITLICTELRHSRNKAAEALRDQKDAQHSLRLSEARLRRVFESNMIGMVFSDFTGRITHANDYFLNLLGANRADLEAQILNWRDLTPPEFMERSLEAVDKLAVGETISPFEKEYIRKDDGARVSVLVGATRIDDSVVAFVLDLSEQKHAEKALSEAFNQLEDRVVVRTQQLTEANAELSRMVRAAEVSAESLRQSQSFLHSVVEWIPNMIFVKEAKTLRFVRFNRAGEEMLGQKRENLIGKNDFDFFPKEQAEFFIENDRRVLTNRAMTDIPEEPIATPQGIRYLHTRKIPLLDKNGEPEYLLGISEDITDKKVAEQHRLELVQAQAARSEAEKTAERLAVLSEASAKLSETLEDVERAFHECAKVVVERFAHACAIDLYDEKTRQFKRVAWAGDLSPADAIGSEADEVRQVWAEQRPWRSRSANGLSAQMIVPITSYGARFGVMSFFDRLDAPAYDDLDLSIAQDLAKRVSLAIENAKLFSQANEASRAKSAFLANISHEIRTPLGAMLGFAELALDTKPEGEQGQHIATIVRNGRELLRIVDEILDLSKAEYNRIQIEKLPFDLSRLLDEVQDLLQVRADEKGLFLRVEKSPDVPNELVSDRMRLRQVLLNIVGNAIKFTEKGGVEVKVRFVPNEDSATQGCLEFLVIDTGIGLSAEQADKLFNAFVQADDSTTRKYGGTGLGLFLSRKIANLLGGDVQLKTSERGQGSTFVISADVELNAAVVARVETTALPSETQPMRVEATPEKHAKILVVDDAPDNRHLVRAFLNKMQLGCDTAVNGLEGVEKALHADFDLVLMDIQMPEMDGFAAVAELRRQKYIKPVIALTAHAMKGDRERCLEGGFDDYLCKPVSRQSLTECLSRHLPGLMTSQPSPERPLPSPSL